MTRENLSWILADGLTWFLRGGVNLHRHRLPFLQNAQTEGRAQEVKVDEQAFWVEED